MKREVVKKSVINKIKKDLLTEKEEILNKMSKVQELDAQGDEIDQIQANIIAMVGNHLGNRDKEKLLKIQIAFEKMKNNAFGICLECEEPIAEKRLLANPCCTSCIICAERKEILSRKK